MKKKTFNLVVGIANGVATIASAVVAYIQPAYTVPIIASIGIVDTAIVEVCSQFVEADS